MASTTDLGKWMLTNGGEYNPETAYEQLTMVMYENSTYITLKTVQGITPTDDHINYQLMAKGFNPTALESVQAEDTSGVLGEVGGTVSAQDLINWVVDQAATKLLKISDLVSVQTNDATKGVSAALAYAMGQKLDQLNSNLNFYYRGENPNKDVKTLASGIYQIDGGNEAYTPTRWGMLIVFSASNYGYALFTHTDGSVYVRTWSQRNGSYYIDWKKLSN